jgi:hypothetical protein
MAGLLDDLPNYWGDNTTKDPGTGLTQADRRDPLWAGLIQGGMGLLAAGQDITPAARAQMIAQAGQTYGGIPGAMMAQRSAGAQQVLQQQQLKAGQSKLDAQARLAALAKTPAFQEAVAQLDPAERALVQASLDAGDIGHATTILSAASRERTAKAETLRKEKRDDAKAAAAEAKEKAKGMWGNSLEGRARDTLINGKTDPEWLKNPENAAAYAQAHDYLSRERPVTVGNQTYILPALPDIGDYPKPGGAPAAGSPAATAPKFVPPKPGEVVDNPANQSKTFLNPNNPKEVITEFSDGTAKVVDAETGREIRKETAPKVDEQTQRKANDAKEAKVKFDVAASDFLKEWNAATPLEQANAIFGRPSKAGSAWANLAALVKETQIFNLGVLNGGDRDFITQAIADPTSMKALGTDPKIVLAQVQKIMNILDAGVKERDRQAQPKSRVPKAAAGGGGGKPKRWNPETNQLED